MKAIGNFLWFVCGGLVMGLAWWLAGLIAFLSILGIPWGRACFVIARLCFLPFGRVAVSRRDVTGKDSFFWGVFCWGARPFFFCFWRRSGSELSRFGLR